MKRSSENRLSDDQPSSSTDIISRTALQELKDLFEENNGTKMLPTVLSAVKIEDTPTRTSYSASVVTAEAEMMLTNANTDPELLLHIWHLTGIYNHSHDHLMENVFPRPSFVHNLVERSNRCILAGLDRGPSKYSTVIYDMGKPSLVSSTTTNDYTMNS
jgi:hypothetical protein